MGLKIMMRMLRAMMMILRRKIVSPGLAGVDVANGRPVVFKPENDHE